MDRCSDASPSQRHESGHLNSFSTVSFKVKDLQLLIFLLFPGEMLLVSLQKSCMKNRNPVPHVEGGECPSSLCKRRPSRVVVNPPESSALTTRKTYDY